MGIVDKRSVFESWDWRYLELIRYKTYSELRLESSRSYIGFLWWIVDPLLQMLVYYVVFGKLFFSSSKPANFVPFLLIGITVWKWLSAGVTNGAYAIVNYGYLTRQIHLPKVIFPVTSIIAETIRFFFAFGIVLVWLWLARIPPAPVYAALPLVLAAQLLFIAALGVFLAALVPFVPDLMLIIRNALNLTFFLSGILYSGAALKGVFRTLFYLNPMAHYLDSFRNVLMYNTWPDWEALGILSALSLLMLWAGIWMIFRWDRLYPRVLPQ